MHQYKLNCVRANVAFAAVDRQGIEPAEYLPSRSIGTFASNEVIQTCRDRLCALLYKHSECVAHRFVVDHKADVHTFVLLKVFGVDDALLVRIGSTYVKYVNDELLHLQRQCESVASSSSRALTSFHVEPLSPAFIMSVDCSSMKIMSLCIQSAHSAALQQ